jgi:hypothetical protein
MRAIIILAGAAMAVSFFMTWVEVPFAGPDISPASALGDGLIDPGSGRWQTMAFLGGFALAALAVVLAVTGRPGAGLLGLAAGVTPFAILIDAYLRADDLRRDLNLPFPIEIRDLNDIATVADDFLRLGVWMYLGGAALLIVAALASGRR